MKKVTYGLIVIIIVLILIVFVWPYIMGASLRSQIYEINKNGLPNNGKLKIISYHVGWLSSKMNLQISLPVSSITQPGKTKNIVMNVKLDVANGPVTKLDKGLTDKSWGWGRGVANGTLAFVKPSAKDYPQIVGLARPIQFEVWAHWGGTLTMFARLPAGNLLVDKKQGLQITSGDIVENATVNKTFSNVLINLAANNIHIMQAGSGEAHISNITYYTKMRKAPEGLWLGHAKVTIPQISVVQKDQNLGQVQDIVFDGNSQLDKNKNIIATMQANINKISIMGQQTMGPFKLNMNVNNLQPKAIKNLQTKAKSVTTELNAPANPKWSTKQQNAFYQKQAEQAFAEIQPLFVDALTGVDIKLNTLELDSAAGKTQLTGRFTFPDEINGSVNDPNALLNLAMASTGHLHISLAYPIAVAGAAILSSSLNKATEKDSHVNQDFKNPNTLLRNLAQEGIVKQTQYDYSVSLDYKNQQVTLNGKTLEQVMTILQKMGLILVPNQWPKGKAKDHVRQEAAPKSAA